MPIAGCKCHNTWSVDSEAAGQLKCVGMKVLVTSNNRLERSRVASSVSHGGKSMIGIKCLRLTLAKPRVAQPHR